MSFVGSLGKRLSFKLSTVEPQSRMSASVIVVCIDLESLLRREPIKYLYDNLSGTALCQPSSGQWFPVVGRASGKGSTYNSQQTVWARACWNEGTLQFLYFGIGFMHLYL